MSAAVAPKPGSIYYIPPVVAPNDRPIVGRQAIMVKLTPSKSQPWYGTITGDVDRSGIAQVGGDRFTAEQVAALRSRGLNGQEIEVVLVRREAPTDEIWVGLRHYCCVLGMECPVLERRARDGKIKVIAPSGEAKWVRPDGWCHTPRRLPGQNEWGY